MEEILLSIIVPVYNTETYLEQCLTSICHQLNSQTELIIINDGSTDQSETIILAYQQQYSTQSIRYVFQNNEGVSVARNKGTSLAQGRYIWFVDSDDYITDNAISELLAIIRMNTSEIIHFHLSYLYEERLLVSQNYSIEAFESNSIAYKEYLASYDFNVTTKLFRRDFLKRIAIPFPDKLYYEDIVAVLYVLYAQSFYYYPAYLYIYRRNQQSSITHQVDSAKQLDVIKVTQLIEKQNEQYIDSVFYQRWLRFRSYYSLLYVAKICQDTNNAYFLKEYLYKEYHSEQQQISNLTSDYLLENLV